MSYGRSSKKRAVGSPFAKTSSRRTRRRAGVEPREVRKMNIDQIDFYGEKKFCKKCSKYVRFLMSIYHSYCIDCGSIVSLFSTKDKKKLFAQPANAWKKSKAFHLS